MKTTIYVTINLGILPSPANPAIPEHNQRAIPRDAAPTPGTAFPAGIHASEPLPGEPLSQPPSPATFHAGNRPSVDAPAPAPPPSSPAIPNDTAKKEALHRLSLCRSELLRQTMSELQWEDIWADLAFQLPGKTTQENHATTSAQGCPCPHCGQPGTAPQP